MDRRRKEELVPVLAKAADREHCAKDVVLADDGEHVYMDGLTADGDHVVFRYWVPPESWDVLAAWVADPRGEPPRVTLRAPNRHRVSS
jgi:hypothetical protein